MAVDTRARNVWWSRLHFLVRFTGLVGALAVAVGLAVALVDGILTWETVEYAWKQLQPLAHGESVSEYPPTAVGLLFGGAVAGLFALIVEMVMVLRIVAGRRSAFGFNVAVQLALATLLFIGINVWSFGHAVRFDWTREQSFTLDPKIESDLRNLTTEQGKTTIVIYVHHKAFGRLSDKSDAYGAAAEQKVIEKVEDLVDQFRTLGPQFSVVVLDAEEKEDAGPEAASPGSNDRYRARPKGYAEKVKDLPAELQKAVENTAENTIFFHARGQVQRMSFNDFYRLDRDASRRERNLVLDYQGVGPFARRVLTIEQRRPRVALAVAHEAFGGQGALEEFTLAGLRKSLEAQGCEVYDVELRQGLDGRVPRQSVVRLSDERKMEEVRDRLREQNLWLDFGPRIQSNWVRATAGTVGALAPLGGLSVAEALGATAAYERAVPDRRTLLRPDMFRIDDPFRPFAPPLEYTRDGEKKAFFDKDRDEPEAVAQLVLFSPEGAAVVSQIITDARDGRKVALTEKAALDPVRVGEYAHLSGDLHRKLEVVLADCDLLIVPRLTLRDLSRGSWFPNREFYAFDPAQAEAVRDYLKAGKPILLLFGPTNEPRRASSEADPLETLMTEIGFRFSKQTVLFPEEAKTITRQRAGTFTLAQGAEAPPVMFHWGPEAISYVPRTVSLMASPQGGLLAATALPPGRSVVTKPHPNPLRQSMDLTSRGLGQPLELSIRHPRIIRFQPDKASPMERAAALTTVSQALVRPEVSVLGGPLLAAIYESRKGSQSEYEPDYEAEFILTDPKGWNEVQPFATAKGPPQFVAPVASDPSMGTPDEERHGQFPIAVAVEAQLPQEWVLGRDELPRARVVAIGSGGVFNGPDLTPAREKLLVETCNWLMGRDDSLARNGQTWEYPRLEMTRREHNLWVWGACVGLPAVFAWLGLVVLLVRRLR